MNRITKFAFVTPWFGSGNGGAEAFCESLARHVAADGHEIEIWTTCSRAAFYPWEENYYDAGLHDEDGLAVRRFPVDDRNGDIFVAAERALAAATEGADIETERRFFDNSINSAELTAHAARAGDDTFVCFMPYLYGTTVNVAPRVTCPTGMIPSLHDEPQAYTSVVEDSFNAVDGIYFQSAGEQQLAATIFDLTQKPTGRLGVGFDSKEPADAKAFRAKHGIDGPFLFYCGRKVPGKGFDVALDYFKSAREDERLKDLQFVVSGSGEFDMTPHEDCGVIDLGFLSDEDLEGAMAACAVFCQPSQLEAFSIVLMQAWLEGRPALVNGLCDVTRGHCVTANSGLWFTDRHEFAEALIYFIEHPAEADQMGRNGRAYVETEYNWRAVMERFYALVDAVAVARD